LGRGERGGRSEKSEKVEGQQYTSIVPSSMGATEPVFLNVYGAQESIPTNEFLLKIPAQNTSWVENTNHE
jgi:hypothetical protein